MTREVHRLYTKSQLYARLRVQTFDLASLAHWPTAHDTGCDWPTA